MSGKAQFEFRNHSRVPSGDVERCWGPESSQIRQGHEAWPPLTLGLFPQKQLKKDLNREGTIHVVSKRKTCLSPNIANKITRLQKAQLLWARSSGLRFSTGRTHSPGWGLFTVHPESLRKQCVHEAQVTSLPWEKPLQTLCPLKQCLHSWCLQKTSQPQ